MRAPFLTSLTKKASTGIHRRLSVELQTQPIAVAVRFAIAVATRFAMVPTSQLKVLLRLPTRRSKFGQHVIITPRLRLGIHAARNPLSFDGVVGGPSSVRSPFAFLSTYNFRPSSTTHTRDFASSPSASNKYRGFDSYLGSRSIRRSIDSSSPSSAITAIDGKVHDANAMTTNIETRITALPFQSRAGSSRLPSERDFAISIARKVENYQIVYIALHRS